MHLSQQLWVWPSEALAAGRAPRRVRAADALMGLVHARHAPRVRDEGRGRAVASARGLAVKTVGGLMFHPAGVALSPAPWKGEPHEEKRGRIYFSSLRHALHAVCARRSQCHSGQEYLRQIAKRGKNKVCSYVYPFILTSDADSDWALDVCAAVPQGYQIVGAYDVNGILVTTNQCLQTIV